MAFASEEAEFFAGGGNEPAIRDTVEAWPGEEMIEASVRKLFERYECYLNQALAGGINMEGLAPLYASDFIAASPAGVLTGKKTSSSGRPQPRAMGTIEPSERRTCAR